MSYNGVVAEKRKASEQSYLQSFGTYVSGFSSYIPSGLKKLQSSTQTHDERDKVLWVGFDYYEKGGKSRRCLLLSFVNGFQIWDIEDQPDHICELVSKREGAIKCFKFLQTPPAGAPKGRLTDKHPVIAMASAEDSLKFEKTSVKLYSLREQDTVNTMRFRSEVHSIQCSKRMLMVALHGHIYGFDIVNMNKIFSREYYPQELSHMRTGRSLSSTSLRPTQASSLPSSLVALGPRWLAYPSKRMQGVKDEGPTTTAVDQLVEAAKVLADLSYKTVSGYLAPETPAAGPPSPSAEDQANFGNVVVYDVSAGKTVAHFRAHKEPLAYLAFDPSGTLLVTAGVSGCEFNVFQIRPSSGPAHENALPIYTLIRGRTIATITDITFSNDSRWMAVSSAHGTTHIYAINPEGGPVNIHTHIPSEPIASHQLPVINRPTEPKHLGLNVIERIKQAHAPAEETTKTYSPITAATIMCTPSKMKIMVVTQAGILTQYNLRPHGPTPGPDVDPKTLQLTVEPTFYWDVCRRSNWPQLLTRIKSKAGDHHDQAEGGPAGALSPAATAAAAGKAKDKSNDPTWLSNVEICTHTVHLRPLWAGPQFTFKTYRKPEGNLSDQLFMPPVQDESKIEAKYKPVGAGGGKSNAHEASSWSPVDLEEGVPLSPLGKQIKDHLHQAIKTPMRFAEKKTETVLVDSLVSEYKNHASSSSSSPLGPSHSPTVSRAVDKSVGPHDNPPPLRIDSHQTYEYDDDEEDGYMS